MMSGADTSVVRIMKIFPNSRNHGEWLVARLDRQLLMWPRKRRRAYPAIQR